ncbi:hypothetical protein U0X36_26095 [Bacillus thuringiensis]|uniref:hypothetical protein n=1 Tax=Bacillus thuringiensis TaxID=1428 RepID=UPI000E46F4AA|nr:hypothetical protein [Bacillus thuringiensis]MDZ3956287.1 hypothetical protein [Bacillus thuringiensis]RGP42993.1 hypothetical protein BTW32_30340 [Bacillus thuringiensis]
MTKYQLEYDKVLATKKDFVLEETGEIISGVSMLIRFGKIFEEKPSSGLYITYVDGEDLTLPGLLRIAYDSEKKEFSFYPHDILGDNYEVVGYTKDVGVGFSVSHFISKKEFVEIIEKYGHLFATDTSLSNCAFYVHEIETVK